MLQSKTILSFIGARAGSKGLKNKNILDLAGKPLIAWSIEASLGSKYVDRTIVSTDGEHIARAAKDYGADVPFLRPEELAADNSLLDEAIEHCLNWLREKEGLNYDYVILLQPTSPFRTPKLLDEAIEYFFEHKKTDKDMLVSVVPAPKKSGWLMHKNDAGYVEFSFNVSKERHRRQELPQYYFYNGFIYMGAPDIMKTISKNVYNMLPYVIDEALGTDIDSQDDFKKALEIFKQKGK